MADPKEPRDRMGSTIYGWQPGQYARPKDKQETILKVVVSIMGVSLLCCACSAAIGAYYYL